MKNIFFILFFLGCFCHQSKAQCGVTINTFPYNESFELNGGSWVSGGVGDDWAWGTPAKAIIQTAGNGIRCWTVGGLSGSFYNFNERSYLLSPCFDFTNVVNPHIKFKIYWETENQYDGATFQYTTNNGLTWTNVGTPNDPVDCMNANWFNSSNITALSTLATPRHGWSGTSLPTNGNCLGGGGSLGWVTAQHCLSNLAGMPNVQFRFAFGAGSICNDYDGVAIDDITISEASPNAADFSFACTGNGLEYQFTNTSILCPTIFNWNFGDPLAGANNISNLPNPTHNFTSPGTYNVTFTVSGPCNSASTITKTVTTLGLNLTLVNNSCFNNNTGAITANGTGITGIPTYTLQPGGLSNNTGIFNNLGAGTYTITLSDAAGCTKSSTITITASNPISWVAVAPNNISCNGGNTGGINALATGGNGPFLYHLAPLNLTNNNGTFNSLIVGTYTVTATDANGCSISSTVLLVQPLPILFVSINTSNLNCFNDASGQINVQFSGGIGGVTYSIIPTGATSPNGQFTGLNANNYTIIATDATGCTASTTTSLSQPPEIVITQTTITQPGCNPNNDGIIKISAYGGIGNLSYSNGGPFGTDTIFSNLTSGTYTVIVKDATGCTKSTLATLLNQNAPNFTSVTATAVSCLGSSDGSINATATGNAPIFIYTINPGNGTDAMGDFNNLSAGIYTITVSDINSCSNTTVVQINSPERMKFENLRYTAGNCGSNLDAQIFANVTGGVGNKTYVLNPGNVTSSDGIFSSIQVAGLYTITVSDANQCIELATIRLEERICCDNLVIPNAFSPNNDLKNDEFKILNIKGIDIKEFIIYNRWGGIAFKSQNINDSWDGKTKGIENEIGTYYYFIRYSCLSTGKEQTIKGDVTLIR